MNHASLCKRTYKRVLGFRSIIPFRLDHMRFHSIAVLLLLAFSGTLSAQFVITTTSLPAGTINTGYNQQLMQSGAGGPVSWFIYTCPPASNCFLGGTPAPGLTLDMDTGIISGTPTTVGTFTFQVQAEFNNSAEQVAMATLSIVIQNVCMPTFTPASPLPPGDIGIRYGQIQFVAVGCPGPYTFTEVPTSPFGGTLPPGLSLSPAGLLTGTPSGTGTFNFYLTATDSHSNATQVEYTIVLNPLPTPSTPSPLPNAPVGVPYSQTITATGGVPPYTFSLDGQPPGITNITPGGGVIYGTPTTAGTFNFNIGVQDSLRGHTTTPYKVTFVTVVSQIQVAPLSLTFNANLQGIRPPSQTIAIIPVTGAVPPDNYHVVVDNGQDNGAAPAWITVTPVTGVAPAGLVVSVNQGGMPVGVYPARVQVIDSNGLATDVAVTLNVANALVQLTVAPSILNYATRSATPINLTEELLVTNNGAGSLNFTTAVVGNSSWISSVTSTADQTDTNGPVLVQVQLNTKGLKAGAYRDAIQVSSPAGNIQIPVSLFIAASGPVLALDTTGVFFQAIEGGGSTVNQEVKILNLGDPSSTINWTATFFGGASKWLSLVNSNGSATSSNPGTLTLALAPGATDLAAGPYYAIIKITGASGLNSPQYLTAVLNLEPSGATPTPYLTPGGLYFTAVAGGAAPASQQVQVNTSSASALIFDAAVTTADGSSWLSATPPSGNASGQTAGSITVSVDPTGLAPGIYSGYVNVSIGGSLQSVNVTFVVQSGSSSSATRPLITGLKPEATGCTATKLAITETGIANNFAVPAGWPATLIVQLNDDCSAAVASGSVVASFSNGDPPLNLTGDSLGNYSTTWQPGGVNANMVITINGTSGTLKPATAKLYGGIAPNQTPPPTIAQGGTLNNFNPVVAAPLAPGTIAQVFGTGLATAPVSTGKLPLPMEFDNTFALVGPSQAPLYFLSSGQINIQVPNEATATQQLPIVLSVNNALTLPATLNVIPAAPGVLSKLDGPTPPSVQNGATIIAQHSADFSLVTSAKPAKPSEYLVMYLVGLGATNPSVASGAQAPGAPNFANVTAQPLVTVGGQHSNVVFAGLSPGFVGLYQINFQVPSGAASGNLEVDVTQNGVAANPTMLPVSQ